MCFYNDDYDWSAEVNDVTFVRTEKLNVCEECRRRIEPGEWRRRIEQREHEECQICEDSYSDDYISADADSYDTKQEHAEALAELAEHKHSYGETYSGATCRECCLLLAAIYDLEEKEGCPEYARQPLGGTLREELHEEAYGRESTYVKHAVEMFPELAEHSICLGLQRA